MKVRGIVPVYKTHFIIAGSELNESTWDFGSDDLCIVMEPPDSAVVICGAQQGDPEVTCENLDAPPPPLTQVPEGWEIGMEVSICTKLPPLLIEASNSGVLLDGHPLIPTTGWTRIRVLGHGRAAARIDDTLPESYQITAWAEPGPRDTLHLAPPAP